MLNFIENCINNISGRIGFQFQKSNKKSLRTTHPDGRIEELTEDRSFMFGAGLAIGGNNPHLTSLPQGEQSHASMIEASSVDEPVT